MVGLTGAWGGFGGFVGGVARGALAGATNNGYQQLKEPCNDFNSKALGRATSLGLVGGLIGKAGHNIYRLIDIFKYPINKIPAANYGTAIGGGIANQ